MNRFCTGLSRLLEFTMALGLLAITATVIVQVFLSALFNSSITGANELITKLFVYITAIGAAVAIGRGEHIAITVLSDEMPPDKKPLLQSLSLLLVALLNAVVVAYSVHWINITGHFLMPTTQLPRIVAQIAVPLGSALAVVFCIAMLFNIRHDDSAPDKDAPHNTPTSDTPPAADSSEATT